MHLQPRSAGRVVATLITVLGFAYIVDAIVFWHTGNPINFVLYMLTGVVAAIFMRRKGSDQTGFSVNLFLVPLGIVELTLPETILLAVSGAVGSTVASKKSLWTRDSVLQLANEATAAAAASFAYHSLVPGGGRTAAIRFFFSSRGRHTRCYRDWSSDVCSSDLNAKIVAFAFEGLQAEGSPGDPE